MIKNTEFLKQVKEFHTLMQQPVVETPSVMPEDRNKLRISLIFEELKEYAEASGLLHYFSVLCGTTSEIFNEDIKNDEYVPVIDLVEQLDALADIQYVLSGTVLENGFGDIFLDAFNEVQRSNMSKVDDKESDAMSTKIKYTNEGIETICILSSVGSYITQRASDNKVLKSHKYSPASLKQFIK